MDKIVILFDVQNLYHSSKVFGGSKISYKDLIAKISEGRETKLAIAYTANRSEKDVGSFHKALKSSGIEVYSKRIGFKKDKDNEKGRLIPVNFDTEIAVDALMAKNDFPDLNTVVLCTGNGGFVYLVEALQSMGVNVETWSFDQSTSRELKERTKFVEIPKECLLSAHQLNEEVVKC